MTKSVDFRGPVSRSWMRFCPVVLSGSLPYIFIFEVRPLLSSGPMATTATTMTAAQMASVRHGRVALARARRSVNERFCAPPTP